MTAYYTKQNLTADDRSDLICELPSGSFIELGDIILSSLPDKDIEEIAGRWLGPKVTREIYADTGECHALTLHIDTADELGQYGILATLSGSLIKNSRLRWNGNSWFMSSCELNKTILDITYPNVVGIVEDLVEIRIQPMPVLQCIINELAKD
jgi:hypothetical protein